jgi:hypothetical protein
MPSLTELLMRWLIGRCRHDRNFKERRWVQDGTPFIHFVCIDCGFEDRGHVHGDDTEGWTSDGWEYTKNGKKVTAWESTRV